MTLANMAKEKSSKHYTYGMRLRGFSIGCQPLQGFLRREDDLSGKYYDLIVYDRPLTETELKNYELDFLEGTNNV